MSVRELVPGLLVRVVSFLRTVYRIPSTVRCETLRPCEVSNDAKQSLLPLSRSTSDSGEKLMEELSRIDPWAASQFGLKNLALQDFVMRLLYESSVQPALPQVGSSFIILSYTWHNSEWTPHPSLGCPSNDTQLPDSSNVVRVPLPVPQPIRRFLVRSTLHRAEFDT